MKKIWLIGAGLMAQEYVKCLNEMKAEFIIVGNGNSSADKIQEITNSKIIRGGIENFLELNPNIPDYAIVATGVDKLNNIALKLINYGIKEILLEKPGGISLSEVRNISYYAKKNNTNVYVAYNRRFYSSVLAAQKIIADEGGIKSVNFDFTEWSHEVEKLQKDISIKNSWLFNNSTHVIDLAFYLTGGYPKEIQSFSLGGVNWHPSSSIYAGCGVAANGALFSYNANWESAGRWGLELCTNESKIILRPLEILQITKKGQLSINEISINNDLDSKFKPGLYLQIKSFLGDKIGLCTIEQQSLMAEIYYKIANYKL